MSLVEHAKRELEIAGLFGADSDYGGMLGTATLRLVEEFAKEGHSGFSAAMAVSLFEKLARYQPLTPLTGADDEWCEVAEEQLSPHETVPLFQNKRCGHVFKADGKAWDIDGRIFREPNGVCFTSRESRVYITFPYTPVREYVDVPAADAEKPAP